MLLITKIKCGDCEIDGEIEIIGLAPGVNPDHLFEYLGYNEFTGDMYFCCPHCKCQLVVNPMDALGPGMIQGMPLYRMAAQEHSRKGIFRPLAGPY